MGILSIHKQIADHKRKELEKRTEPFLKEYQELVEKHKCGFKTQIVYLTDGIMTHLIVVDFTEEIEKNKKK